MRRESEQGEGVSEVDLNVVLLPDAATQALLLKLSKDVAAILEPDFILDKGQFRPHVSLFPNQYPAGNIERIIVELQELARGTAAFPIRLGGYSQISGFVFVDVHKTGPLVSLHQQAVEVLNPLREGHMPTLVADLRGLSEGQRANVVTYGNPIVGELWEPHVTLTHTANMERAQAVLAELPPVEFAFGVDALHLTRFGPYGTCPEILETFNFGR